MYHGILDCKNEDEDVDNYEHGEDVDNYEHGEDVDNYEHGEDVDNYEHGEDVDNYEHGEDVDNYEHGEDVDNYEHGEDVDNYEHGEDEYEDEVQHKRESEGEAEGVGCIAPSIATENDYGAGRTNDRIDTEDNFSPPTKRRRRSALQCN